MDLAEWCRVLFAVPPGAIEDEEYVVAVVVELRALMELLGILECERMKAEQVVQLGELSRCPAR